MVNEEKKEEVLKWLKQFKRLSSSRFVGLLGIDYNSVKTILENLEQEKKVIKVEETNSTYWRLNKDENNE